MVQCWALDCNHYNNRQTCQFFRMPKHPKTRDKWLKLLRRTSPGPGVRVCSCHFRDGRKENFPELFQRNIDKRMDFPDLSVRRAKRKSDSLLDAKNEENGYVLSEEIIELKIDMSPEPSSEQEMTESSEEIEPTNRDDSTESTYTYKITQIQDYSHNPLSSKPVEAPKINDIKVQYVSSAVQEAELYFLRKELEEKNQKLNYLTSQFTFHHIEKDEKLIRFYTGISSKELFLALVALVENIPMNYIYKWKAQKMSKTDQLFLTLIKLKLNFPLLDLAHRFNISVATVSNIVLSHVCLLKEVLYDQLMSNIIPSDQTGVSNCRVVLDCTELITIKSGIKPPKVQNQNYNFHKHCQTWKSLLGVAPNGVIMYISSLFPGSFSDKSIVKHCGIFDQLENGDLLIAGTGLLVSDIVPYGVSLSSSASFSGSQQGNNAEFSSKGGGNVDKAVKRLKEYKILESLPQNYYSFADSIVKCIAGLTNFQYLSGVYTEAPS